MTAKGQPVRKYKQPEQRWEALHARIEAHASLLADQGDLVLKTIDGNRYWYLRFHLPVDEHGHRRHRTLYVGRECDQELVARVRALLEYYREPRRQLQELAAYTRLMKSLNRRARAATRHLRA